MSVPIFYNGFCYFLEIITIINDIDEQSNISDNYNKETEKRDTYTLHRDRDETILAVTTDPDNYNKEKEKRDTHTFNRDETIMAVTNDKIGSKYLFII